MNAVGGAVQKVSRVLGRAATMTTETAGAVGGAAIDGVVGGVTGATAGIKKGLRQGRRSTPAAALTIGVIGAVGLVEWPVLLAVGGTALAVQQLSKRRADGQAKTTKTTTTASKPVNSAEGTQPTPIKSAKSPAPRRSPAKKSTTARRTPPARGRQ